MAETAAGFTWGLIGPGVIAHRFADAVDRLPGSRLATVWGRNRERADAFAQHWSRDATSVRGTDKLGDLLDDASIDGVYIATPHGHHAEYIMACVDAGKAVLCEKSLVTSAALAEQVLARARARKVFVMEALWTRFLPIYAVVARWLRDGAIGNIRLVRSSFCFPCVFDPTSRLFNPDLGGGALHDLGVYNLSMARWALQVANTTYPEPLRLHAHGTLAPTGVEQHVAAQLDFADGVAIQLTCSVDSSADNAMIIFGTRGHIEIAPRFWEAERAVLHRQDVTPEIVDAPFEINGFEGEIREAERCVRAGLCESPVMPHADTIATLRWIDALRGQLGVTPAPGAVSPRL